LWKVNWDQLWLKRPRLYNDVKEVLRRQSGLACCASSRARCSRACELRVLLLTSPGDTLTGGFPVDCLNGSVVEFACTTPDFRGRRRICRPVETTQKVVNELGSLLGRECKRGIK
jgi:hypothetical protein